MRLERLERLESTKSDMLWQPLCDDERAGAGHLSEMRDRIWYARSCTRVLVLAGAAAILSSVSSSAAMSAIISGASAISKYKINSEIPAAGTRHCLRVRPLRVGCYRELYNILP